MTVVSHFFLRGYPGYIMPYIKILFFTNGIYRCMTVINKYIYNPCMNKFRYTKF